MTRFALTMITLGLAVGPVWGEEEPPEVRVRMTGDVERPESEGPAPAIAELYVDEQTTDPTFEELYAGATLALPHGSVSEFVEDFHSRFNVNHASFCINCHDVGSGHGTSTMYGTGLDNGLANAADRRLFVARPVEPWRVLVVSDAEGVNGRYVQRVVGLDLETVRAESGEPIKRVLETRYYPVNRLILREPTAAGGGDGGAEATRNPMTPMTPKHWIGVGTEEVGEALRAQLKLDEEVGLAVVRVVDDSPAKGAGIELHDVIVRVGETPMKTFADLSAAVEQAGGKGETLSIELVRKGKRRTIEVTPTERTTEKTAANEDAVRRGLEFMTTRRMLGVVAPAREDAVRWVEFGPGIVVEAQGALPKGVTLRVEKSGGEPARIHVERGGKFWDVSEKSLDDLPEDLRGPVRSFLPKRPDPRHVTLTGTLSPDGTGMMFGSADVGQLNLNFTGNLSSPETPADGLRKQLERVERQLVELQKAVEALRKANAEE